MLSFAGGLSVRTFTYDLAKILHDASVWADLTGVPVQVAAIGEGQAEAHGAASPWLRVDLLPEEDRPLHRTALARYLHVTLPQSYRVELAEARVRVNWRAMSYRPN